MTKKRAFTFEKAQKAEQKFTQNTFRKVVMAAKR